MIVEANAITGKESDYLTADIACLNPDNLHATLVSSAGSHCEVWRSNRRGHAEQDKGSYYEFVIKYPRGQHSSSEIAMLSNHYRMLKGALEDVVPAALFFITQINGHPNVGVLASAVNIWFDIANPQNREEAIELLRTHPKPRNQLQRFLQTARQWRIDDNPRLIDLYGIDNLVMDIDREIRYLDSFFVFFFEDMLDLLQEHDDELEHRIDISCQRLIYLEEILRLAET